MNAIAHGLPEDISSGVTSAVPGNIQFALDPYRTPRTTPGNLFFSPSLEAFLALVQEYWSNWSVAAIRR